MRDKLTEYENTISNLFFFFSDNIFLFLLYQGNNIQDIFFPGHDSLWIIYWFQNASSKSLTSDIGDIYTVCEYCSQITIACLKWWQIMFVIFWQPFYASDEDWRKFLMEVTKVFSISIAINYVWCQKESKYILMLVDK